MSEQDTQQAEGVETSAPAEDTAAGSQPEDQTPSEGTGQPEEAKKKATSETKSDDAGSGDKEQFQKSESKQDFKPSSRRSASFRIQQLAAQNAEYRKRFGPLKDEDKEHAEDEPQSDDEPKPDIRRAAREEAQRVMEPVLKEQQKAADDAEINDLFSGENAGKRPEYEPRIRKAWELAQYKEVSAADVFKILDYDAAVARARTEAVEEYKKAQKEARESSGSGNSNINRTGKDGKSVLDLPDEEFLKHNEKVKAGL